jgi:hypothetical protein
VHPGYAASQRIRKRIEESFGWMKVIAGLRKTKYRGLEKVRWAFTFAAAAFCLDLEHCEHRAGAGTDASP